MLGIKIHKVMLDLEKLEKKLDSALEKETSESLSQWLLSKRLKNHFSYLGEGILETVESSTNRSFVCIKVSSPIMDKKQSIIYGNQNNYKMAS